LFAFRFPCSSVSNHHAKLHFENGQFFLTDSKSSNGTHFYMREPIEITKKDLAVRMGRSTVKMRLHDYYKAKILDRRIKFLKSEPPRRNPNYNLSKSNPQYHQIVKKLQR
jgi:predicted component of type VI protein secretion system